MNTATAPLPTASPTLGGDLYRAVWRWHFYAGLLVLPFLAWLAITGGLYVFKNEIDGFFHRELKQVPAHQAAAQPAQRLADAALAAHPGQLLKYTPAARPTDSAELGIRTDAGERLSVYVDPASARVLGALPEGGSVAWTLRRLHSLKYFGPVARGAIEIAAGWSVLLVLTGIYLWWPRGRKKGVVTVRGQPRQRVFWRDVHAVTGLFVGTMVVFLAVTGMPWSVLWGAKVNEWSNGSNFGYPAGVRVQVPMSQLKLDAGTPPAWSLQQARLPQSAAAGHEGHEGHEGHDAHAGHEGPGAASASAHPASAPHAIGLDAAVARFKALGIAPGFSVQLPRGATGVYTASVYPDDVSLQRVIHLDQYSGATLLDMDYGHYGALGQGLEWGISVHLGQQFGVANQALLVISCLAIVLLCVSAAVMWWKRRPSGGLGVPPLPQQRRVMRNLLLVLMVGGLVFPLVGASLLIMTGIDWLLHRAGRPG